jgi:hypothetical protein
VRHIASVLEKIRIAHRGFFQSEQSPRINVYISCRRLKGKKWTTGFPSIRYFLYVC